LDHESRNFDSEQHAAIGIDSNDEMSRKAGAARIYDFTNQEMVGQPAERIVPLDFQFDGRGLLPKLGPGERMGAFETVRLAKDGPSSPGPATTSLVRDEKGNVVDPLLIAREMSERKQLDEALRAANEAVRSTHAAADSANRAKKDHLVAVGHEMRAAIDSIGGFVDLLTRVGKLTSPQRRYIGLVKTANAALLAIVDDILNFSKVEGAQLDLELHPLFFGNPRGGGRSVTDGIVESGETGLISLKPLSS